MTLRWGTPAARWTLAATVLASALAAVDGTVVGIALPYIGRQFHSPLVSMQWVVNGYLLALGSLLLVGGSLGDQLGRKRVFAVGIVWFTLASAACALAPDAAVLILTRILQGAGAALLVPGSLAILEASFTEEDRWRAIGAWAGLGGVATAVGPLLGGYLITAASWRWIFLINVPVAAAALAITIRHVPESRRPNAAPLDRPGAALTVLFLAGLTYGLVEGPAHGWGSPVVLSTLVLGTAAGGALLVVEGRRSAPMLPLAIFRSRQFTVTNGLTFLVYAALGGTLFLLPIELEVVDRYSALEAGGALLPVTLLMLLFSARSGRLAARVGPRLQMSIGPLFVAVGLVLLARTTHDSSYATGVLPGMLVFAVGLLMTVAPLTATALSSAPDEHAGLASAFNNDVARVGGLIAVAVLPALAGLAGHAYLHPVALARGFRTAVYWSALWCAAGGLLAAAGIRNRASAGRTTAPVGSPAYHCALDAPPLSADS